MYSCSTYRCQNRECARQYLTSNRKRPSSFQCWHILCGVIANETSLNFSTQLKRAFTDYFSISLATFQNKIISKTVLNNQAKVRRILVANTGKYLSVSHSYEELGDNVTQFHYKLAAEVLKMCEKRGLAIQNSCKIQAQQYLPVNLNLGLGRGRDRLFPEDLWPVRQSSKSMSFKFTERPYLKS